jgi:hypothetical protein
MRVNTIVTHLRPEDAYTIIDFLDQLRSMLVQTYGDEITSMLQESLQSKQNGEDDNDELF